MNTSPPLVYNLREQIVARLRSDILSGRLAAGQRLSELQLVERFGVSRTPIREALQQLTHEGLLEGKPNSGVRVAPQPPDDIRELVVPIRRRVEAFALRSFFAEINDDDRRHWQEILDRMQRACAAEDYAAIAEQDLEFHYSIIRRAGKRDLESIWNSLVARVRSHFCETHPTNYATPMEIHAEHARIVAAFLSGDLTKALAALEENIN